MSLTTHWSPYDAEKLGYQRRTLCGVLADVRDIAIAPNCPECIAILKDREAQIQRLREPDRDERQSER